MSQETAARGHAWHYRAELQGEEPNHYPDAIPVEDVRRRLFHWQAVERVAPWAGSAWGVIQAVNTMVHHEGIVRGASRAARNTERAVTGGADKLDRDTLDRLTAVSV